MRGKTPKKVSSVKGHCFFLFRVKFPVWRRKWRSLARVNWRLVSIFLFTSVAVACKRQMFLLAHRVWGTTFTSCQKLLVPICFFLCYINVILAACFTLKGHDPLIDFLWFLFLVGKMICPMMQDHFLWPLLRGKALYCGWIRVLGSSIYSKVPSGSE